MFSFMPWGLKRFQQARCLHFVTFSCYHRAPLLAIPEARCIFEQTLERVRKWYGLYVTGYVVMPEHVHLLISEPHAPAWRWRFRCLSRSFPTNFTSSPRAVHSGKRVTMTSKATSIAIR